MGREGGGKRAATALAWRCELTAGRRGTSQRPPCDQVARDSSSALVSDLSERCICSLWPASRTGSTLCVRYHTILSWLIANSASVKAKQATLSTVGTEKQILQRRHATRLSRLQYSLAHLLLRTYTLVETFSASRRISFPAGGRSRRFSATLPRPPTASAGFWSPDPIRCNPSNHLSALMPTKPCSGRSMRFYLILRASPAPRDTSKEGNTVNFDDKRAEQGVLMFVLHLWQSIMSREG